jgi:hypothetical protein
VLIGLTFDATVTRPSGVVQDTTHEHNIGRGTGTLARVTKSAKAGGSFAVSTVTPIEHERGDTREGAAPNRRLASDTAVRR